MLTELWCKPPNQPHHHRKSPLGSIDRRPSCRRINWIPHATLNRRNALQSIQRIQTRTRRQITRSNLTVISIFQSGRTINHLSKRSEATAAHSNNRPIPKRPKPGRIPNSGKYGRSNPARIREILRYLLPRRDRRYSTRGSGRISTRSSIVR